MRKRGTSGLLKGKCTRADCESANDQRDRGCRGVVGCGVHSTKTVVISIPSLRQSMVRAGGRGLDQGGSRRQPKATEFPTRRSSASIPLSENSSRCDYWAIGLCLYPLSLAAVTVHLVGDNEVAGVREENHVVQDSQDGCGHRRLCPGGNGRSGTTGL